MKHRTCALLTLAASLGILVAAPLALTGCAASHSDAKHAEDASVYGEWELVAFGEADSLSASGRGVVMTIDPEGRVFGSGGVNRFSGPIDLTTLRNGRLKAGPVAATKMAGTDDAMRVEARFFEILDMGAKWDLQSRNMLVIFDDTGIIALFRRVTADT